MECAARRPWMVLALLTSTITAIVAAVAVRQHLSLGAALGSWFGSLALGQIAYLGLVIGLGADEDSGRIMADPGPASPR